jgi:hypothetical protein
VRTTSSGWKAATVAKPAVAPAAAFSQVHGSADGISGGREVVASLPPPELEVEVTRAGELEDVRRLPPVALVDEADARLGTGRNAGQGYPRSGRW